MSDRETVEKVMRATRIAILTYEDDAGRLVSTPMGTQDFDDPSMPEGPLRRAVVFRLTPDAA